VELYFFQNGYVGISAIENGATNVCGLAPERSLRSLGFHPGGLPPALRPALRAPARCDLIMGAYTVSGSASPNDRSLAGRALGPAL